MPNNARPPPCHVVELRQYTLHPAQRDVLIDLFDREFVETQEALGMTVMGQFRDLGDADRFVWLRGFADRAARKAGLAAFYGGPVWREHRSVANATMVDSDNVLLLQPAWPGSGIGMGGRSRGAPGATAAPAGVVEVTIMSLRRPASEDLLAECRALAPAIERDGALLQAWYVTDPAANDFPALPVREGEHMLVAMALFAGIDDVGARTTDVAARVATWLSAPVQTLRLAPTARSALHA